MDFIISFFRDVLDGPLYIGICILCAILICSCIGYLADGYLKKKKQREKYAASHVEIKDSSVQDQSGGIQVGVAQSTASTIGEVSSTSSATQSIPIVQPGQVSNSTNEQSSSLS